MRTSRFGTLPQGLGGLSLAAADTLRLRAAVNEWVSATFPEHRRHLSHAPPEYSAEEGAWSVALGAKNMNGASVPLGRILLSDDGSVVRALEPEQVMRDIDALLAGLASGETRRDRIQGPLYDFRLGDGILGAATLDDGQIDLLLTDPPYGISKPYTCERQIPRRLRKNGRDFIMPKGNFGEWDQPANPSNWLEAVLPKVGGWAVSFCAQAQIGQYVECLSDHRFVAVGTLVWQKTNPVPFNHRFKPINAWEALVCGKRPGTKFNGSVVHNVFLHKSPSPQTRIHPTQKPLALLKEFIALFSDAGDFVFDPFAGAASTLLAARDEGRRTLSYEANPAIFDAACARILSAEDLWMSNDH